MRSCTSWNRRGTENHRRRGGPGPIIGPTRQGCGYRGWPLAFSGQLPGGGGRDAEHFEIGHRGGVRRGRGNRHRRGGPGAGVAERDAGEGRALLHQRGRRERRRPRHVRGRHPRRRQVSAQRRRHQGARGRGHRPADPLRHQHASSRRPRRRQRRVHRLGGRHRPRERPQEHDPQRAGRPAAHRLHGPDRRSPGRRRGAGAPPGPRSHQRRLGRLLPRPAAPSTAATCCTAPRRSSTTPTAAAARSGSGCSTASSRSTSTPPSPATAA